jgi:hypothetical protein
MTPHDDALPCPACGFLTVEGSYGSYGICQVCGWEDDGVQLANPACGGRANSESLIDAQAAAIADYPVSVEVADGIRRDPRWRPLNDSEQVVARTERDEEDWKNKATDALDECYWMFKHPS